LLAHHTTKEMRAAVTKKGYTPTYSYSTDGTYMMCVLAPATA